MAFKDKKPQKDDSKTKIQQDVDDIRTCQTKRDALIKELDRIKDDIESVKKWAKLILQG